MHHAYSWVDYSSAMMTLETSFVKCVHVLDCELECNIVQACMCVCRSVCVDPRPINIKIRRSDVPKRANSHTTLEPH